jgi:hypothetical protein
MRACRGLPSPPPLLPTCAKRPPSGSQYTSSSSALTPASSCRARGACVYCQAWSGPAVASPPKASNTSLEGAWW